MIYEINSYEYGSIEAMCKWLYDNLKTIENIVPEGYPRVVQESSFASLSATAYSLASFAFALALTCVSVALPYN